MNINDIVSAGDETYEEVIFAWLLNTVCQYRCTYCSYGNELNKREPVANEIAYKGVLDRLSLSNLPEYEVDLLGGEPTLHKEILVILESLNSYNSCKKISINTNLARELKWFEALDDIKFNKLTISASYHPEYDNKDKDLYFKKSVELSLTKNITYICNINIYEDSWDQTRDMIERLLHNSVPVGLNLLDSVKDVWECTYTSEFKREFKEYLEYIRREFSVNPLTEELIRLVDKNNAEHFISDYKIRMDRLDRYLGWNCRATYWVIEPDGEIYNRCTKTPLHILNKNIDEIVTCPVSIGCPCPDCFKFPKSNSNAR